MQFPTAVARHSPTETEPKCIIYRLFGYRPLWCSPARNDCLNFVNGTNEENAKHTMAGGGGRG